MVRSLLTNSLLAIAWALCACGDDEPPERVEARCASVACGDHGSCDETDGTCVCEAGWAGTGCDACADGYHEQAGSCVADERCTPDTCGPHGSCSLETGALICTCAEGYRGDRCDACADGYHEQAGSCVADERCAPETCGPHGTCSDETGAIICTCAEGYRGDRCDACAPGYGRDPSGACVPCEGTPFSCGTSEERPPLGYEPPRFRLVPVGTVDGGGEQWSEASDVNDAGQLVGTFYQRPTAGNLRVFAFRFSEGAGIENLGDPATTTYGKAINGAGTIAGYGSWAAVDQAFTHDGTRLERIGASAAGSSRVAAINDAGQVAGECEEHFALSICRHTPGIGWEHFGSGGATSITADGSLVGSSGAVANHGYFFDGDTFTPLLAASAFPNHAAGVSSNGRFVVATHHVPRLTQSGVGLLVDRLTGGAPLAIEDIDGHPFRDLFVQPRDVNDGGFAVGEAENAHGVAKPWLFDPRRGESLPLEQLIELPAGESWFLESASAISNNGHIAATGSRGEGAESTAVLLVPIDWPAAVEAPPVEAAGEIAASYTAQVLPDGAEGTGTKAIGLTADHHVALLLSALDESIAAPLLRPAWWSAASGLVLVGGEFGPLYTPLPVRTSPGGRLVGHGIVLDEFTDLRFFRAFAGGPLGAEDLESAGVAGGDGHSFGYDIDDAGRIAAECFVASGYHACLRGADGNWSLLFEGRAFAISNDGALVGSTAEDAVVVDEGTTTGLGLGPGATPLAVSDSGRFVAGIHGHGFVFDRERGVVDWLPDRFGDPATVGRVEPLAVNDAGVVVGRAFDGAGEPGAFVYDPQAGVLVLLDDVAPVGTLHLREARDVAADGTIVANGVEEDGTSRAVLLVPSPQ